MVKVGLFAIWPLWLILITLLAIKLFGVTFATLIFAKYTPLIDSQNYLNGNYTIDHATRTRFINWLAFELNRLVGPYLAHLTFALLSAAGLLYYYISGGRRWILMAFLLLPSSLVWTSVVGKDAIYFGGFGLALVIWSKYAIRPLNLTDRILLIVSLGICLLLRPHYSIALIWIFLSTYLVKKYQAVAFPWLLAIFFIGAAVIYYSGIGESLFLRGIGGIDPLARASRFDSLGIKLHTEEGYLRYKSLALLGALYGIIGPFPSEAIIRYEFMPFLFEGILIFIMPYGILLFANRMTFADKKQFFRIFLWCLIPAIIILMLLHAPFGLLNPGSATRWRVNFEQIFYLAPLLLIFRFLDEKK